MHLPHAVTRSHLGRPEAAAQVRMKARVLKPVEQVCLCNFTSLG